MLVLDSTTKSIVAVMSGAAATNNPDFTAAFADNTGTSFTESANDGALNGTSPVTIVAAPASGAKRVIKSITIENRDTADITFTLSYDNNSTLRTIANVTLNVGYTWTTNGTFDQFGSLTQSFGIVDLDSQVSGVLTVPNGGTGVATLTGVVKASGTSAFTAGNVNLATEVTGTLPIANGGTGSTSTTFVDLATNVTGTLPAANGGTGVTSLGTGVATALGQNVTGTGGIALDTSPNFTTPVLGTPTSGTLSNCTVDGTDAVGFRNTPVNSQSTSYTFVAADAGKTILHPTTDNNARTFTIPSNASVPFPVGTVISVVNLVNTITIAITSDTLYLAGAGTTGSRSLAVWGTATIMKVTSTSWIIAGNGVT
jgi:hypothetical protein